MDIKFSFKREKHFKKENSWPNINTFWDIALCLTLLAVLACVFFGYFLFMDANKEPSSAEIPSGGQIETVKKDRIDKVLEYFAIQKQKSNQIIISPSPLVDPSL